MPFTLENDTVRAHFQASPTTSVAVHLYGATVMTWKVNDHEQLWMSSKAILNGSKAIRGGPHTDEVYGGIPLVFPQFGTVEGSKLPQHGFARCSFWKQESYSETQDSITIQFVLAPADVADALRSVWDYKFRLVYTVAITAKGTLATTLRAENHDHRSFDMTWLLHTYLRVPSIEGTAVRGLGGSTYSDKTRSLAAFQQVGDLTVSEEVDRVFAGVVPATSKPVAVFHSGAHVVTVDRVAGPATGHSFADVVVWNPWIEKAKGMADFDNEGYKSMICVEVGDVAKTVSVAPGQVREAGQVLWAASAVSGAPKL